MTSKTINIALRSTLILVIVLVSGREVSAQYDGQYSQYMFNGFVMNPAYAGSQGTMVASLQYKNQWAKIEDAPSTILLSANSPISGNASAGIMFINDQVGVHSINSFSLAGSYGIPLTETIKLNFGLQGGIVSQRSDYSSLTDDLHDPQDQLFYQSDYKTTFAQFGAGLYLYAPNFYVGMSIPNINVTSEPIPKDNYDGKMHYFFTAGYLLNLTVDLKLQPSILLRSIQGAGSNIDLNTNVILKDVLWLGLSYRSNSSMVFLTQMQVTESLRLGYAYDTPISKNTPFVNPSHEILLSYYFKGRKSTVVEQKYF